MARRKKQLSEAERDAPGQFFRLPYSVIRSKQFQECNGIGIKLLCTLLLQYNGRNNGDISIASKIMQSYGWKDKRKLRLGLNALIGNELLVLTRQGGRHCCSLYAFSWLRINACEDRDGNTKLDVPDTNRPCINF
jgi:hypothetical protein